MSKGIDHRGAGAQINIMDAFFYVLACGSMAVITVSFLLWLRF